MGGTCPSCGSTDIYDRADTEGCGCLDCEFTWTPKARRRRPVRKSARHQDYISRRDIAILGGDPSL